MSADDLYAELLEAGESPPGVGDQVDAGTLAALHELRGRLADPALWAEPPPGLPDSIVAAIAAERDAAPASGVDQEATVTPITAGRRRLRPARSWMLAAAAVLVVVVAAGALLATRGTEDKGDRFALTGTDLALPAGGTLTIVKTGSGLSITLDVHGLPPAPPGYFYQAWMKGDRGSVAIGTFHARESGEAIHLWSGVDTAAYPEITVTLQQEGAGPESSGQVVLRGSLVG